MTKLGERSVPRVVDLFCGIGGLSHGFHLEGFEVAGGIDTDSSCRYAYESNNGEAEFINKSIESVTSSEVSDMFGRESSPSVLIGCAPCQPFSSYSNSASGTERSDWALLREFGRLIESTKPDIVSMENVPRLANSAKYPVFSEFLDSLWLAGYFVSYGVVDSSHYGVPQRRKRLVLLASRHGEIELMPPEPTVEVPTVWDAIGHLPPITAGEASDGDRLHKASRLSSANLTRIRNSVPGGSWRDWDCDLRSSCHVKESGKYYSAVYGRMAWNAPAPTITTQFYSFGSGRFGHPDQDRALSIREAALLQTFPEDYQFLSQEEDVRFRSLGRQIGNAVPVNLARAIAASVKSHLARHGYAF